MTPRPITSFHQIRAPVGIDLLAASLSLIMRVCGFDILWFRFGQARRARGVQIAQALGAPVRVFGLPAMSAV